MNKNLFFIYAIARQAAKGKIANEKAIELIMARIKSMLNI